MFLDVRNLAFVHTFCYVSFVVLFTCRNLDLQPGLWGGSEIAFGHGQVLKLHPDEGDVHG